MYCARPKLLPSIYLLHPLSLSPLFSSFLFPYNLPSSSPPPPSLFLPHALCLHLALRTQSGTSLLYSSFWWPKPNKSSVSCSLSTSLTVFLPPSRPFFFFLIFSSSSPPFFLLSSSSFPPFFLLSSLPLLFLLLCASLLVLCLVAALPYYSATALSATLVLALRFGPKCKWFEFV